MPKLSLPFYRDGEEFEPSVTLQDLEDFEEAEKNALQKPMTHTLRIRIKFIEKILSRHAEKPVALKATASQIHEAVHNIWWTQALGERQLPLESAAVISPTAKPDESTSPSASPESATPAASAG